MEVRSEAKTAAFAVLDTQNILWYFGALAGTGGSVAIIMQVPESARGTWILLVALAFMAGYAVTVFALRREGWIVPAGVLAAAGVTFVPIAGLGFERLIGVIGSGSVPDTSAVTGGSNPPAVGSESFHGSSFALALLTVAAGLAVYYLVRYSYVFAWVAIAALIATQILVPVFDSHPGGDARFDAALAVGILFVFLGFYLDTGGLRGQAFWWHLVGLGAITSAISYHVGSHGAGWWIAALAAGLAALAVAVLLERATFAFFGLLGLYAPFAHYSTDWFANLGTAFALAVIGFSILGLGMLVQRESGRLTRLAPRRG